MKRQEALKVFGENLKRLRVSRGLSQDELAKLVGYTNRSSINKIEIGRSGIPANKVNELARVLGVSPLDLFREEAVDPIDLTVKDDGLLSLFEQLSPESQSKLKEYAEFLLSKEGES